MCITSITYFNFIKKEEDNKLLNIIFYLFSAGCTSIMLACGGQTIYENTSLDIRIGILITYLIIFIVIKFGIKGVYKFNMIATPIMIIFFCLISFIFQNKEVFFIDTLPIINSFSYAGYNILSVLPFLKAISSETEFIEGYYGILIGFILILIVSLALKLFLNSYFDLIMLETIPILKIISITNKYYSYIYSIVLYISILTTAVSCLYVVTKGKNIIIISLPLLAISFLGFSTLLEKLYTNFGYIGILIIIYILTKGIIYAKRK
jgi:uncharacterized membrane protein YkvI